MTPRPCPTPGCFGRLPRSSQTMCDTCASRDVRLPPRPALPPLPPVQAPTPAPKAAIGRPRLPRHPCIEPGCERDATRLRCTPHEQLARRLGLLYSPDPLPRPIGAVGRPPTHAPPKDAPQIAGARAWLRYEHSRSTCDRVYVPTRVLAALPEVTISGRAERFAAPLTVGYRMFRAGCDPDPGPAWFFLECADHVRDPAQPRRWDRHLDPDGGLRSAILPRRPPARHRWLA